MTGNHPYEYRHVTPEEIHQIMRRAHAERAQVVRDLVLALFRRKPAVGDATSEPSLNAAACR